MKYCGTYINSDGSWRHGARGGKLWKLSDFSQTITEASEAVASGACCSVMHNGRQYHITVTRGANVTVLTLFAEPIEKSLDDKIEETIEEVKGSPLRLFMTVPIMRMFADVLKDFTGIIDEETIVSIIKRVGSELNS